MDTDTAVDPTFVSIGRIEDVARVCHEANRAFCISLGDQSQLSWWEAPSWQRDSAIAGVESIDDGSTATPEQSHQSWLEHKECDGWTYGPEKDPDRKTHPCLVPFDELPPEQQMKDKLFFAIATTLLELDEDPRCP